MMLDTDILLHRLTAATALPTILDASWNIFDLIQQVASGFSGPGDGWAFTQIDAAACRGRRALSAARSLPDDMCDDEPPMRVFVSHDQAARVLAALASLVRLRLTQACQRATDRDDLRACGAGAAAAAEAHALLVTEGGAV